MGERERCTFGADQVEPATIYFIKRISPAYGTNTEEELRTSTWLGSGTIYLCRITNVKKAREGMICLPFLKQINGEEVD